MPLPPFDARGLMPPFLGTDARTPDRSPYFVGIVEFAGALGTTAHRRQLLRNLIAYRALLAQDDYLSGIQFIDGSFVENVELTASRPPGDIDVFSLLNAPAKYLSNPPSWAASGLPFWQDEIIHRDKNKSRFSLDTYALLFEELRPDSLINGVIYWYSLFSHQRATLAWKGFVALALDPLGDNAALTALGSA